MIFVTVGGELPFERLVRAMDAWAAAHPGEEVLAQIGGGAYLPAHMRWQRSLGREAYAAAVAGAELVVAHAGIGSVVTAGEHGKPIVLLPRRARFGEHRNDHQRDTAARLGGRPGRPRRRGRGGAARRDRRGAGRRRGRPGAGAAHRAPRLPRPAPGVRAGLIRRSSSLPGA